MTNKKRKKYDLGGYIDTIKNPEASMQGDILKAAAKTAELNNSVWLQGLDVLGNTLINAGVNGMVGAVGAKLGAAGAAKTATQSATTATQTNNTDTTENGSKTNTQQGSNGWSKGLGLLNVGTQFGAGLLRALPSLFAQGGKVEGHDHNVPIEAEGGEMLAMPWQDQAMTIEGASHEQGGVDLNVPTGTKIYSKRVKDGKGVSMAKRKERRDRELKKWEKIVKDDPNNQIAKDTLEKIRRNNEIEEQNDLAYMELHKAKKDLANQVKNVSKNYGKGGGLDIAMARQASQEFSQIEGEDREKFAWGGFAGLFKKTPNNNTTASGNNTAMGHLRGYKLTALPIIKNEKKLVEFVEGVGKTESEFWKEVNKAGRNNRTKYGNVFLNGGFGKINNTTDLFKLILKQSQATGSKRDGQRYREDMFNTLLPIFQKYGVEDQLGALKSATNNTDIETGNNNTGNKNTTTNPTTGQQGGNNNSSIFSNITAGDAIGLAGIIHNMTKPTKAFTDNFQGKPQYRNMYNDYGKKSLLELSGMKDNLRDIRDQNIQELRDRRTAQIYNNNNNGRDLNVIRAMNLGTLSQINDTVNKSYANYAYMDNQAKQLRVQMLQNIDDRKMAEDIRVDNANRELRDAFYNSKLGGELAFGKGLQAIGKNLSDINYRELARQHEQEMLQRQKEDWEARFRSLQDNLNAIGTKYNILPIEEDDHKQTPPNTKTKKTTVKVSSTTGKTKS